VANEIKTTTSFKVAKGTYKEDLSLSVNTDFSQYEAATGIKSIGTTATAIPIDNLSQAGECVFKNLDSSTGVQIGHKITGTFYPFLRLEAGEFLKARIATEVEPYARADTTTVDLFYYIVDSPEYITEESSSSSSSSSSYIENWSSSSESSSTSESSQSSQSSSSSSSSMEGYPSSYIVSGFGTVGCNGTYNVDGTYSGYYRYENTTGNSYIQRYSNYWGLHWSDGTLMYFTSNGEPLQDYPDSTTEWFVMIGNSPAGTTTPKPEMSSSSSSSS